jgi:hypothetical protein
MAGAMISARGAAGAQSVDELGYEDFAGQIRSKFLVRLTPLRVVELKLIKAPPDPLIRQISGCRPPPDADNEKFSLIFSGPKSGLLESAIHQFEHDRLGRFKMFISPIGAGYDPEVRYQAAFNRPPPHGLQAGTKGNLHNKSI